MYFDIRIIISLLASFLSPLHVFFFRYFLFPKAKGSFETGETAIVQH